MSEKLPLGPTQPPAPSGTPPAASSPISRTQFEYFTEKLFAQFRLESAQQIAETNDRLNQQLAATNSILTQELARIHSQFKASDDRTTLDFTNINASIAEVVASTNNRVNNLEFQTKSDLNASIAEVVASTDNRVNNLEFQTKSDIYNSSTVKGPVKG